MDQLDKLLVFVRAAEASSFARAAKSLGMTASGVGKSIARLEAELGVQLLSRTTRSVKLTEDGVSFFEHCRKILDELDAALGLMSSRRGVPRGRLRVSLPATLGRLFVVPRLPSLLQRYPDIALEVSSSDRWVHLVEESIDVALRIGTLTDSSLVARKLGWHQVLTVASPAYLVGQRVADTGDLSRHACIVFRQPSTGRERPWRFQHAGKSLEVRPRARLTLDEGEAMVAAARAALGVCQVPSYMAAAGLADGSLVEVLPALRPRPDPIHAVYLAQRNPRPALRAFIEFLSTIPELDGTRGCPRGGLP